MLNGVRAVSLIRSFGVATPISTNEIRSSSGVEGAVLIEETDGGEEIVGEIEAQRRVDLVDEEHQPFGALDERDLAQVADQPLREGVVRRARPTRPTRSRADRAAPAPRRRKPLYHWSAVVCAPSSVRSMMTGNDAVLRELLGGPVHQARLAHLPRRQDVGEVSGETVPEQVAVRVALQIDAATRLDGAAGDEL